MDTLLKKLKEQLEEARDGYKYTDVDATYWEPGQPQVEECPFGCKIDIIEHTPEKWGRVTDRDAYSQTRVCRKHKFARIYVITGVTAAVHKWSPLQAGQSLIK